MAMDNIPIPIHIQYLQIYLSMVHIFLNIFFPIDLIYVLQFDNNVMLHNHMDEYLRIVRFLIKQNQVLVYDILVSYIDIYLLRKVHDIYYNKILFHFQTNHLHCLLSQKDPAGPNRSRPEPDGVGNR